MSNTQDSVKRKKEKATIINFKKAKLEGSFAKQIQNIIKSMNMDEGWSDRPDFLFCNDSEIIGVEHFLVDLLSDQQQAYSRKREVNQNRILNKYKNQDVVAQKDEVLKDVETLVTTDFNKFNNINFNNFLDEFRRIQREHNSAAYKENLNAKNINNSLGYMIEITYANNQWTIWKNNKSRQQDVNKIPMTEEIFNILKSFQLTDFVILCMHDILNKKMNYYVFSIKDFEKSIQKQNVIVCDRFEPRHSGKIINSIEFKMS